MTLGKYLKEVFLNRWNLLIFLGGLGFALLSGRPDIVAPVVVAGELLYIGMLGTHPRFQKSVDARNAKATRESAEVTSARSLESIMRALPPRLLQRFEALRSRCLEQRHIAMQIKDPASAGEPPPLDSMQLAGLDRLLWIFLKLLFTEHSLDRFLETAGDAEIKREIERLEIRLKKVGDPAGSPQAERMRKALEDSIETSRARLANFEKARDNSELVKLEIDRLENKIRSLSELAVNRQEPEFISAQVDQVASSMLQTERTMNDLQFATGIDLADEAVPPLLTRQTIKTT
jgi:chemotaxis protein histidine kinase CheA